LWASQGARRELAARMSRACRHRPSRDRLRREADRVASMRSCRPQQPAARPDVPVCSNNWLRHAGHLQQDAASLSNLWQPVDRASETARLTRARDAQLLHQQANSCGKPTPFAPGSKRPAPVGQHSQRLAAVAQPLRKPEPTRPILSRRRSLRGAAGAKSGSAQTRADDLQKAHEKTHERDLVQPQHDLRDANSGPAWPPRSAPAWQAYWTEASPAWKGPRPPPAQANAVVDELDKLFQSCTIRPRGRGFGPAQSPVIRHRDIPRRFEEESRAWCRTPRPTLRRYSRRTRQPRELKTKLESRSLPPPRPARKHLPQSRIQREEGQVRSAQEAMEQASVMDILCREARCTSH